MELKSTGIKISIIVPVYGVEKYSKDAVKNIKIKSISTNPYVIRPMKI